MKVKRNTQGRTQWWGQGRGRLFVALVALATGGACDTTASKQQSNVRSADNLEARCEVPPPFKGNFQPQLDWQWTGSAVMPAYKQVMMTPVIVDVNQDGTPDIVFSSFDGDFYNTTAANGGNPNTDGVLRAISGKANSDGTPVELWTVTDPALRVKPAASIAAGDIDGDGKVEICGVPEDGRGIICFENDGTFKFRSAQDFYDYNEWGGPTLADLDGDGAVEILDGNRVYTNTGALKWVGSDGMGGPMYTGPVSLAADIDQDGTLEVVNDRAVYRADGTLKCANTQIPHGHVAVGNFDSDAAGEIVVAGYGKLSLLDDNCELLWTRDILVADPSLPQHTPSYNDGGAPNIADFDGDGQLEIGLAGNWDYTVYGADGTVKWSFPIQEYSSGKTTSTVFDLDGDGRLEVIYADERKLRIFDGVTGALRWETEHTSGTTYEYPLVVDVDGDGAADIVVVENTQGATGVTYGFNGIRVFHDALEGWAGTRKIWNQHAYSITNVNNDGTIPAHPATNWLNPKLNNFRVNVANYFGEGPSPYAAADLVASEVKVTCDGYGSLVLSARVRNQGDAPVPAGVKVAFYQGNPASGGTLLGVATAPDALPVGGSSIATISVSTSATGTAEVFAVVDDDGKGAGTITECREDNNSASATGNLTCTVTSKNKPPVALCRDVTVNADAYCKGHSSVNDGSYDPDNGPSPLGITEAPDTAFGLGSHPVTLTASDGEASAQCVGSVTVVDTTKPAVTCPASQVVETCSPSGAPASFKVSATDNCSSVPASCSYASGSIFPVGDTAITCSARDDSGNKASCRFNVTVTGDTVPPTLSCPTSPIAVRACSAKGTRVKFETSATDNCGPVDVSCSQASGTNFPVGETSVTCTAQDAFGNTSSCNFSVIVGGSSGGGDGHGDGDGDHHDGDGDHHDGDGDHHDGDHHDGDGDHHDGDHHDGDGDHGGDARGDLTSGYAYANGTPKASCSGNDGDHHDGGGDHHDGDGDHHDGGGGGGDVCGYCSDGAPTAGLDKGLVLWPPNHKYATLSLADCAEPATDACDNPLPLDKYGHVLSVSSDEVEDATGNGDGSTCEDISIIVGTSFIQVRSEREGTGDGRVYTVHYAVTNDAGASTESTCHVYVPHDQSGSPAVDSGVKYCVGQGCPPGTTEGSPLCK